MPLSVKNSSSSSMNFWAFGFSARVTPAGSLVAKGESLADTIRSVSNYSDIIAIRHPDEESSKLAAKVTSVPVINGGSGPWEHPTQALLYLYTIKTAKGIINDLTIALWGDLLYGRTIHSLAVALRNYDAKVYFAFPDALKMRPGVIDDVNGKMDYTETSARDVKDSYPIDKAYLAWAKQDMMLMHPLPRINEISIDVDDTPYVLDYRQMKHGIYMRMAWLALVLAAV